MKNSIHINPAHKGALHRELGVAAGTPIPTGKLEAAAHSSNPAERKRAVFAENAKHWRHPGHATASPSDIDDAADEEVQAFDRHVAAKGYRR